MQSVPRKHPVAESASRGSLPWKKYDQNRDRLDFGQPFTQRHGNRFGPFDRRHVPGSVDLKQRGGWNSPPHGVMRRNRRPRVLTAAEQQGGAVIVGRTGRASGLFSSALIRPV